MMALFITILSLSFIPYNHQLSTCDTFGYYYLDSDTNAVNAPAFTWVSINNQGTRINGLADDNVKGPYPIGFNFPYYWETPNNIYIGANGYVSFDDIFLSAYPFQPLPCLTRPNNILAPLMADLTFDADTSSCWYWTSTALDTFIIEFDSVRFWSTGGLATFQIILSQRDSSITFQYLTINGEPYGGWLYQNSNSIGIENCLGNIGIQYLSDGLPLLNQLHDSLAVKFFRPHTSLYEIYDAKILNGLNAGSGAIFVSPGDSIRPWTRTKNSGNQILYEVPVKARITDQGDSSVYADSAMLSCRIPGWIDSVTFASSWIPCSTGQYCLKLKTALTFDMCPVNDSILVEIRAIDAWDVMQYDNEPNSAISLNKPGGFANRFIPPQYPISVSGAKFYATSSPATDVTVNVYQDNGPGQSPGDVLATTSININSPNWYTVLFPQPAVITSGSFYIGAISAIENRPLFGVDTVPPFSRRLWEYIGTGNWSFSRFGLANDICIRASTAAGIEEFSNDNPITKTGFIMPNPFSKTTEIRFTNPLRQNKTVMIYNSSGILVRSITTKNESVVWNGRNDVGLILPNGCYFVRLDKSPAKSIQKIIIAR